MMTFYCIHEGGVSSFMVATLESAQHAAMCLRKRGIVVDSEGRRIHPAFA